MLKDANPSAFNGIYLVCGYTDLRYGIDSLAAIVEKKYHMSLFSSYFPCSFVIIVFVAKEFPVAMLSDNQLNNLNKKALIIISL